MLLTVSGRVASGQAAPTGWRASYTPIYFDDVESLQPAVGSQFVRQSAGAITSAAGEVISGARSIKGSYSGTASYTQYLRTNSATLSFTASQTYRVTFKYKILVTPDKGFECLFLSPTGASQGNFLPSINIAGQAGTSGTATLTNTLGSYSDYQVIWNVVGNGAISIDDIRIDHVSSGQTVATEDAEKSAPSLASGLRLSGSANVTTSPAEVVNGAASVRLSNFASVETDPTVLPLSANTYYIVELKYRILNRGTNNNIVYVNLQPAGSNDPALGINSGRMLKNAEVTGTFSTGALTANAANYVIGVHAQENAVIVVDDIRLIRVDPTQMTSQPPVWAGLASRPYPRLGNYQQSDTNNIVQGSPGEQAPFAYSSEQFEDRLAFADVVAGGVVKVQTQDSDFVRRLQRKNPNIVVLPYRISEEQGIISSQYAPTNASVDLDWQIQTGLDNSWFARDSQGNLVSETESIYSYIKMMDVSPFCPVVSGNTFITYQNEWITQKVLRSGIWDGIFLDNLFARINPHVPNFYNGALLDYDVNRNGVRDETPASLSNIYRAGATQILQSIRTAEGDLTLVMGNAGPQPDLAVAPYLNGYTFECLNRAWYAPDISTGFSEPAWRHVFDDYLAAQARSRAPHINIMEGCGDHHGLTPTAQDIRVARMVMSTTALSDGFAEYDLFDAGSAPYWFDEYSVDGTGTAVENRKYKGYLGNALRPAMELKSPATVVWTESFESNSFPSALTPSDSAKVYVTNAAAEVISGEGSLVLSNPNHTGASNVSVSTRIDKVPLSAGHTYVIEFDWRILETLDKAFGVNIWNAGGAGSYYNGSDIVAGDSGKAHFPITAESGNNLQIAFYLSDGGKVAIDNIRVTDGGAGPWRRDFEHGMVIVNPINRPHTFTASELAGPYNKTGIKRIKGTQDLVTNSGEPVSDGFTIPAADAIILLSDFTAVPPPSYLLNISTRMKVLAGENVLIGGFIVTGTEPKKVLIRGLGPSLPVTGQLQDPTLQLNQGQTVVATNDNWRTDQEQEIKDSTIPPTNDSESAMVKTLLPGSYTAILSGKDNGLGVGQVEVYDLSQAAASQLANISTRGFVDTGDNVMIGGVIVGGGTSGSTAKVLVRAIGPSLSEQGVNGALQDPTLELRDVNAQLVAQNDSWRSDQEQNIKDTTVPPTDDRECAIVQTLGAGNYTAIVRGKNNKTGVGLIEVYNLR